MVGSSSTSGRERTLQVMFTIWRSDVSGERNCFPRKTDEDRNGEMKEKSLGEEVTGEGWEKGLGEILPFVPVREAIFLGFARTS